MSKRQLPKGVSLEWYRPSRSRAELVICSTWQSWVSHWDVGRGVSRRCGGQDCGLCEIGSPQQLRFVVLTIDSRRRAALLELRERHRGIVERLENEWHGGPGATLRVWRDGEARNSPVEVRLLDRERVHVEIRDVSKLVGVLGAEPIRSGDVLRAEAAAEPREVPMIPSPLAAVEMLGVDPPLRDPAEVMAEFAAALELEEGASSQADQAIQRLVADLSTRATVLKLDDSRLV